MEISELYVQQTYTYKHRDIESDQWRPWRPGYPLVKTPSLHFLLAFLFCPREKLAAMLWTCCTLWRGPRSKKQGGQTAAGEELQLTGQQLTEDRSQPTTTLVSLEAESLYPASNDWGPGRALDCNLGAWEPTYNVPGLLTHRNNNWVLSRYTWGSFVTQQQKINRHTYFLFAMRRGFPTSPSPVGKALPFSPLFPRLPLLLHKHVLEISPERLDSLWIFITLSQCLFPCSSTYRLCYEAKIHACLLPHSHSVLNSLFLSKGGPWHPQWMDGVINECDQQSLIKCLWQH